MRLPRRCRGCGRWFWPQWWRGKYGRADTCSVPCVEKVLDALIKTLVEEEPYETRRERCLRAYAEQWEGEVWE